MAVAAEQDPLDWFISEMSGSYQHEKDMDCFAARYRISAPRMAWHPWPHFLWGIDLCHPPQPHSMVSTLHTDLLDNEKNDLG